jgi:hypothetical protein
VPPDGRLPAMAEAGERLARLRRADSDAKAARVLANLEAMAAVGERPGVSVLARRRNALVTILTALSNTNRV